MIQSICCGHGGSSSCMGACCEGNSRRPSIHIHSGNNQLPGTSCSMCISGGPVVETLQRKGIAWWHRISWYNRCMMFY